MSKSFLLFFTTTLASACASKPVQVTDVEQPMMVASNDDAPSSDVSTPPIVAADGEPVSASPGSCGARALDLCESSGKNMSVDELRKKAKQLIGKRIRVRGTLSVLPGGCTEAACDNSCSDAIVLGQGERGFTLNIGTAETSAPLACIRDAGDPCPGSARRSTAPCCDIRVPQGEVIVIGRVQPDGLENVSICAL